MKFKTAMPPSLLRLLLQEILYSTLETDILQWEISSHSSRSNLIWKLSMDFQIFPQRKLSEIPIMISWTTEWLRYRHSSITSLPIRKSPRVLTSFSISKKRLQNNNLRKRLKNLLNIYIKNKIEVNKTNNLNRDLSSNRSTIRSVAITIRATNNQITRSLEKTNQRLKIM